MKLLRSLMPLIPQPYKNIIKFFLATLKNVDEKEELQRIGKLFADILEDGKVTPQEWLTLAGKNGLGILEGNGKKKKES
jgi:hypothetical protein